MSNLFGLEQLEAAAAVLLAGGETPRQRLAIAWRNHLARINPDKDLPGEVRQRFRALPLFGRNLMLVLASLTEDELVAVYSEVVALRDRVKARLHR